MVCRIPYPNCQAGQCTKYHIQMSGKTVHKTPYLIVRQSDSVYNTKGKFQLGWCAGHHPLIAKQDSVQNTIVAISARWYAEHHTLIVKQDSAHNTILNSRTEQCAQHHT